MERKGSAGHLAALITIAMWGTTFISTKVLLVDFEPVEILFYRFLMGLLALFLVCPRRLKGTTAKQELTFAAAGLCGVCLYYLLENIALTQTLAANVSVIVSVAPFFTALLSHIVFKGQEKLRVNFFLGFVVAMAGIFLISTGGAGVRFNPVGDLLSLLAAMIWAVYSILTQKLSAYGYPTVLTTRRTFFYGILFMVPALFFFDLRWAPERFANPVYVGNFLFLGLGASALCFVTWNVAVKMLGPVKTSVYLYMVPVITVVASVFILHEPLTWATGVGVLLTLCGLVLSGFRRKGERKQQEAQETDAAEVL
nr:DMT family transporter [uncultured Flavonifractor sp.]